MIVLPSTVRDVGESLSIAHAQDNVENRKALVKSLQNVKFLGRLGLPYVATTIRRATSRNSSN